MKKDYKKEMAKTIKKHGLNSNEVAKLIFEWRNFKEMKNFNPLSTHQTLNVICVRIEHTPQFEFDKDSQSYITEKGEDYVKIANITQIIFKQEFIDKFLYYYGRSKVPKEPLNMYTVSFANVKSELLCHLDDPVTYLYNLIEIG